MFRQGKYFELDIDAGRLKTRAGWRRSCGQTAGHPVIESYRIEVDGGNRRGASAPAEAGSMKFAVVVFLESNCDHAAYHRRQARPRSGRGVRVA